MNGAPVTLHVWRVPATRLPTVAWRMARDRGRLRRTPGVRFAKLLGTGQGQQFGPAQIDPTRWATLVVWHTDTTTASAASAPASAMETTAPGGAPTSALEATSVGRAWTALSSAHCRIDLAPLHSRGSWSGQRPFERAHPQAPQDGMVLAVTRARLRPTRAVTFWRAIGAVAPPARQATGLLATFGIGEAPIGWQGTVSLWRGARDLVEFAYRHPDHRAAIEQTPTRRWYAEELFARFAVLRITGDRSTIGWTEA